MCTTVQVQLHSSLRSSMCHDTGIVLYIRLFEWSTFLLGHSRLSTLDNSPDIIGTDHSAVLEYLYEYLLILTTLWPRQIACHTVLLVDSSTPSMILYKECISCMIEIHTYRGGRDFNRPRTTHWPQICVNILIGMFESDPMYKHSKWVSIHSKGARVYWHSFWVYAHSMSPGRVVR